MALFFLVNDLKIKLITSIPAHNALKLRRKSPTRMKSTLVFALMLLCLAGAGSARAQKMKIGDPTKNDGKVEWIPMQIEAGDVPYGVPVERFYEVKNVSTENLILLNVKSGCHCTVVDWTKEPIPPGESGTIRITYDALKEGEFYKIIAITTNFDPEMSIALAMVGKVLPKPADGQ